jgi:activator of HSP90 ATPase
VQRCDEHVPALLYDRSFGRRGAVRGVRPVAPMRALAEVRVDVGVTGRTAPGAACRGGSGMARRVIEQSVALPAPAESLYTMYMDPARHAEITGGKVVISARPGSKFSAFDGTLSGTTLAVVQRRLIVQSWRSKKFHASDPDSTLILAFVPHGEEGRIDLVHLDVPTHDYDGVNEGWEIYYWAPWRAHLERQ